MSDDNINARKTVRGVDGILSITQGIVPLLIAVVVLYIFWSLVKQMMGETKSPELEWSRATYLFAGVEAIAYAAAGFLFGREVHRQRAEQAEQRADKAQAHATKATEKATEETVKGQTLKWVINVKRSAREPQFELEDLAGGEVHVSAQRRVVPASQQDLDELARLADELFP